MQERYNILSSQVLKPKWKKNVWNPVKLNLHCLHFPNCCQKSPTFSQKFVLFRKYDNKKYLTKIGKNSSSFFSVFPDFDDIFTFFLFGHIFNYFHFFIVSVQWKGTNWLGQCLNVAKQRIRAELEATVQQPCTNEQWLDKSWKQQRDSLTRWFYVSL